MHFSAFNSLRNTFKSGLVAFVFCFLSSILNAQVSDGLCDFVSGTQYSGGGAKGCACTWISLDGTVNCAYGNCGASWLDECIEDCNGHNGFPTDQQPRQCTGPAPDPLCWYNGAGSAGEVTCENILLLPISLISFEVMNNGVSNIVNWRTESETNNKDFIVRYSTDGFYFQELIIYPGAGNSSEEISYRFIHHGAARSINYYQLLQIDYDGKTTSYGPISIDNRDQKRTLLKVCNMLGQEVNENYRGIVIYHYSDGSYEKIYK